MYRAFYAIPGSMKTSAGEQSNAVYGVGSMLISMLKTEQPDALLFCFDEGEDTFRHQENAEYKAGRAETPDTFYVQIPRIMDMIDAFQIKRVSNPGFEADDLLCSYATDAVKQGMRVTIVTGDRDAFQLANEHVRISIPHKGYQQPEYLGPTEIYNKYGIRPDQVASYKGLSGDASDNLPGVKGIGPKTAAELLQKYDTLEGIYAHLEEIRPAVKAKLERDKEQAFFCERMARLVCVPRNEPLESLTLRGIPLSSPVAFLRQMDFFSLVTRLESLAKTPYGQQAFAYDMESAPVAQKKKEADSQQLALF